MDPEIENKVNMINQNITALLSNPNIDTREHRDLERMRTQLTEKVLRFKDDLERRTENFKNEIEADTDRINRKIAEYNNNN